MSHAQRHAHRSTLLRRTAIATGLACFGLVFGTAVAADNQHPLITQSMQRDLGLTALQITRLRDVEKASAQEEKLARRALGKNFAGSWVERQADGSHLQVIAASGPVKASVRRAGVQLRQVRHSLLQLEQSKDALDRNVRARIAGISTPVDAGVQSWYVDPKSNAVVVTLAPGATEAGIDFVAASGADIDTVRFETVEGSEELLVQNVAGGNAYGYTGPDGKFYAKGCSVGFSVTQGPHIGFATAAHCGTPNLSVNHGGEWIGHFSQLDNSMDSAWVAVFPGHNMMPYVNDYYTFGAMLPIRGSAEASIGSAVCRSGFRTGFQCGYIRAKNVTVTVLGFGTIYGATETDACGGKGDSGGSWLIGDQAQGVTSTASIPKGQTDNCGLPPAKRATRFAPINPLLQRFGLTLTVTP